MIVLVLLVTVALRLTLVTCAIYFLLSRGPTCRTCAGDMVRIRHRGLEGLLGLERRWCMTCGWNGVVRRAPAAPRHSPHPPLSAPPRWE